MADMEEGNRLRGTIYEQHHLCSRAGSTPGGCNIRCVRYSERVHNQSISTFGLLAAHCSCHRVCYPPLPGNKSITSLSGDMFYLHERGFRTALTVATLTCSTSLVSIIAGVLTEQSGWKTVFIAVLPFNVVGLLGAIFFLPETQYRRSLPVATDGVDAGCTNSTKSDGQEVSVIHNKQAPTTKAMIRYWEGLMSWSGTYSDRSILILGQVDPDPPGRYLHQPDQPGRHLDLAGQRGHHLAVRGHGVHHGTDLHTAPLPPHRLPERLLLRWQLHRRCSGFCGGAHLRLDDAVTVAPEWRRLRSRVPNPRQHH